MAQVETRARKALRRIGIARANLAYLRQPERDRLASIYGRFATRYRISVTSMNRPRAAAGPTPDDCAAVLALQLDGLTSDASGISGINRVESLVLNEHLEVLARDCDGFISAQPLGDAANAAVNAALDRFIARQMGTGTFAGSAL